MEQSPVSPAHPEKIIPETPRLRYIEKTLTLLEPEIDENGKETNWKNLSEKVGPWDSGLELSKEIRNVVREYVLSKFPAIKEKIPSLSELPDDQMLNAVTNGWFEEVGEETGGKRKEVLLAVLAHMARKIEARIYKQIFEKADEEDLKKFGLPSEVRRLAIDCLESSIKADPLFIRYLAYTQLSPKPPKDITPTNLAGPDGQTHSFAEMFPHETSFIEIKLASLAENNSEWKNIPGAKEFAEYTKMLAQFYGEKDPTKTADLHQKVLEDYSKLVTTDFPITIVPPVEGYYKPPYIDPELRVVVRTEESKQEEDFFRSLQSGLADNLKDLGVEQFSEQMKQPLIRSYIALGSYGVNLTFVAAAQQEPAVTLYLDEQIRAYDKNLKDFLPLVDSPEGTFSKTPPKEIEAMSRNDTMLHEFSHKVYSGETPESKRLGAESAMFFAEATAESIHRALAKEMIAQKKLPYTEDQYVAMSIGMALQSIKGNTPDDEYFQADTFVLNGLFENNIAEFDGSKIQIKNNDAFFQYFKDNAKEIIAIYEDHAMTPTKAKKWLQEKCTPQEKLQTLIEYLRTTKE